ncbi:uncharacterized protein LOC132031700 [Lycium ferocissimum]|uniref:uncharacterized protein LOC132031700 n=1 Tax=Lycium ferocissimum TaxID=112874 RepID=UPI002815D137|nr:uncharacterized protein LOC132031700 [Lycium ferocissimum]
MGTAWPNTNGKIWVFVKEDVQVDIILDTVQVLTLHLSQIDGPQDITVSLIYASTDKATRIELWDALYYLSTQIHNPWQVGGDFNVILNEVEKFGGLPVSFVETEDFLHYLNALVNKFPNLEVEHLIKQGSDHAPLLINYKEDSGNIKKSFRFLNFWVENDTFLDVVKQNWVGNFEEVVKVHEVEFEQNPSNSNRGRLQKVQAELIRFYAVEEKLWKQKAEMQWFKDGDRNIVFFHAHEAIRFYKDQFFEDHIPTDFDILKHIPQMVTIEQNQLIHEIPEAEEVKGAVFGLNADSAGGPDGFTGKFFQYAWEIIAEDMVQMEIVHGIRIRGKPANVVIKLDMTKAYDRVSWLFLTKVLRQMGFGEMLIDMPQGFFKSTRGVKQGDPLSPTLFILEAECMSRALNVLHEDGKFKGFGMPKWSPYINHLAYADDTIIFASADDYSLKKVMETLTEYEKTSGQRINKTKSAVYMHEKASEIAVTLVNNVTRIPRKEFPFTYLGVPIYYSRRKIEHYKEISDKVSNRLFSWTGKLLSIGGRITLIKHVLQSMPIHLLSACDPPAGVLANLHRMFAKFFWSKSIGNSSKHWTSWTVLCHPYEEGGLGFRSLQDLKKEHAVLVGWKRGIYVWKKMLQIRDLVEHEIWWQQKQGNSHFWLDNWTGLGSLYHATGTNFDYDRTVVQVHEAVDVGGWNEGMLRDLIPNKIVEHILSTVTPPTNQDAVDKPFWKLEARGKFTVGSAYQFVRQRKEPSLLYNNMWIKGLPIKISFFMWRFWKFKVPLDDAVKKWGI